MPEEVFVVVLVALTMGTGLCIAVAWMVVNYLTTRNAAKAGSGLTTSELQQLLEAAVAEGNADLSRQIDALHARLDELEAPKALPSPEAPPMLRAARAASETP